MSAAKTIWYWNISNHLKLLVTYSHKQIQFSNTKVNKAKQRNANL